MPNNDVKRCFPVSLCDLRKAIFLWLMHVTCEVVENLKYFPVSMFNTVIISKMVCSEKCLFNDVLCTDEPNSSTPCHCH